MFKCGGACKWTFSSPTLPIKLCGLNCKKDYELQNHPQKRLEYLVYPVNPPTISLNHLNQQPVHYSLALPLNQIQSHPANSSAFPPNHMKSHIVKSPYNPVCMKNQPILPEMTPQPHCLSTPSGHEPTECLWGIEIFCLNLLSHWTWKQPQPLQPSMSCWSYMTLSTHNSTSLA